MSHTFEEQNIKMNTPAYKTLSNAEQLAAVFDHATIGMVITDSEGRIINFNRLAEKQFGFTEQEVLGKTVEVLLPSAIHHKHINYRQQYNEQPQVRSMGHGRDLFAQRKNGTTFPVEVSLSHYTKNEEIFIIAFVIDITVRKQHELMVLSQKSELEKNTTEIKLMNNELEQKVNDRTKMLREALVELEKSKEELSEALENEKELSELKSRFVTMASHEFRTPLSTILSSAFLLEKYNQPTPNDKVEKHLQRIKGAVGGMKSILEDFLSLGKLEEALVQTRIEEVSASQIANEIQALLIELESLVKPGQTFAFSNQVTNNVWIDINTLKSILVNLISNAVKFTGEGAEIQVLAVLENNNFKVSVKDSGIGISEEDQQHLFGRFFRGRNAANIQGTGLGLHIVSKYLELMNGKIELKSKLNEGAVFTISIPQPNNNARLL